MSEYGVCMDEVHLTRPSTVLLLQNIIEQGIHYSWLNSGKTVVGRVVNFNLAKEHKRHPFVCLYIESSSHI